MLQFLPQVQIYCEFFIEINIKSVPYFTLGKFYRKKYNFGIALV